MSVRSSTVGRMDWRAVIVVALHGVLAVVGGGIVTKVVFRLVDEHREEEPRFADFIEKPGAQADSAPHRIGAGGGVAQAASVLRGGAWIGALERLAIYAGVVASWPEAIAVVLAVKGLGRYPELRNGERSAVAERFIIGTFVSVLWACGCAGLAIWLRR